MDWANEEYVRLYTRETADDLELSWEAVALWRAMLCKFDRSGVIPVRNGWPSIARMVRIPSDVVERAGPELVTDGRVRVTKHGFVAPNFTEAQTASKSDKLRQRESRDRRREIAMTKQVEITKPRHTRSHAVTKRDQESRDVTLPLLPVAEAPATSHPVIATVETVTAEPEARSKQDRKTKLPSGWEPSRSEANLEAERVAIARGIDLGAELKNMHDWAIANAAKKVDWDAAWRNWTRNSRAHNGTRRGGGGDVLDHLARRAGEQP